MVNKRVYSSEWMMANEEELVILGEGGSLVREEAREWRGAGEGYGDWQAVAGETERHGGNCRERRLEAGE